MEIVGLMLCFGVELIEGNFESYFVVIVVMDCVLSYDELYDVVI